jgi:hypothetical protein
MADGWALPGTLTDGGAAFPAPQLGEWLVRLSATLFFVSFGSNFLRQRPFLILVALHMSLPWISVALAGVFTPIFYPGVFDTTRLFSFERAVYLGC